MLCQGVDISDDVPYSLSANTRHRAES